MAVDVLPGGSRSLFPISTKQPVALRLPAENPALGEVRARLDSYPRLWIIFGEFNTDLVGQSFHVEPQSADLPLQRNSLPANITRS